MGNIFKPYMPRIEKELGLAPETALSVEKKLDKTKQGIKNWVAKVPGLGPSGTGSPSSQSGLSPEREAALRAKIRADSKLEPVPAHTPSRSASARRRAMFAGIKSRLDSQR